MKNIKSIQTQFVVISLVIILLALGTVGGAVSFYIVKHEEEVFISESNVQMGIIESYVRSFYEEIDNNINMAAENPIVLSADDTVTNYLDAKAEDMFTPSINGGVEQKIYEYFDQFASSHKDTLYFYIALENKGYIQWPEGRVGMDSYDPTVRPYYKDALGTGGEIQRTSPYYDVSSNALLISNVREVFDEDGKRLGVLGLDVKQSKIGQVLSGIENGDTGFYMMIHSSGVIMADGMNSDNNFKKIEEVGIEGLDQVLGQIDGDTFEVVIDGEEFTACMNEVAGTDWITVSLIDSSELLAKSIGIIKIVAAISLLMMVVSVALMTILTRKNIIRPINDIAEASKRLALGDVSESQEIKRYLDKGDEIGLLSNSFSELSGAIREKAQYAERISNGDLDFFIKKASDEDVLSTSLINVREILDALVSEINSLVQAAVEGRLDERGNTRKFKGDFRNIVKGINDTLDAVIEPVKEASDVLHEMEKGNLNARVDGDYKGDHAQIKASLNSMADFLRGYVNEISLVLGEIAKGNMDQTVDSEYRGDFAPIKEALNVIIDSLNNMVGEISMSADQVASGSRQVSDGSQELSQGSTEQAGSVEELTASVTEIAVQTRQNAANAQEANRITMEVKDNASKGNRQMSEMLASMDEINEASGNISKIIKVIDEIAFQTNLLALNAAVEAARAGQHGRGFAVVAEEVRNLAGRSADAAKETTVMIEGSIDKVEAGTRTANETAKALQGIVEGVDEAAILVSQIADASVEQASAIDQINGGLEQVSKVVQSNSATAEESAAASEELSSQSELLKDMVSKFTLKDNGDSYRMKEKATKKPKLERVYKKAEDVVICLDDRDFGKY